MIKKCPLPDVYMHKLMFFPFLWQHPVYSVDFLRFSLWIEDCYPSPQQSIIKYESSVYSQQSSVRKKKD